MNSFIAYSLFAVFFAVVGVLLDPVVGPDIRSMLRERSNARSLFLQTGNRNRWPFLAPRSEDVRYADFNAIAWINRWGGHAGQCTLAEHMVRVAQWLAHRGHDSWVCLQGALHDLPEIYPPGDVPGPVLRGPWWLTWGMKWMRRRATRAVHEKCGLPMQLDPAVERADLSVLSDEAHARLRGGPLDEVRVHLPPPSMILGPAWEPDYAIWQWWSLVGWLADRSAAAHPEFDMGRRKALLDLACFAEREAQRLTPDYEEAA